MRRPVIIALAVLPLLATQAHAEEAGRYSALDTIRRAQVGTFSPRLAPPVRVTSARTSPQSERTETSRYDRMDCRPDPSRPLDRAIVCRPMESEKVKSNN